VNISLCPHEVQLLAAALAAINEPWQGIPVVRTDVQRMARKLGIEPEVRAAVVARCCLMYGLKPLPMEGTNDGKLASRF
jgi:hypothetical protein